MGYTRTFDKVCQPHVEKYVWYYCCQLYLQPESSRRHPKTLSNCALPRGFGDTQTMMTPVAELCEIEEVFVFDAWLQIKTRRPQKNIQTFPYPIDSMYGLMKW